MKEDLNIEELFKQGFENFEGNVDPSAWANISQGINAGAAGGAAGATGSGLSMFAKVAIVVGAVATTSVGVWYFTNAEETKETTTTTPINTVADNTVNPSIEEGNESTFSVGDDSEDDASSESIEENGAENDTSPDETTQDEQTYSVDEEMLMDEGPSDDNGLNADNSDGHSQTEDQGTGTENAGDDGSIKPEELVDESNHNVEEPELSARPELESVDGQTAYFSANADNHDEVVWNFGDGEEDTGDAVNHKYERPGKYQVVVEVVQTFNGERKVKTERFIVDIKGTSEITKYPNSFTPNGDNDNDYFEIPSKDIRQMNVTIYDLSGNEIFSASEPGFRWDGRQKDGTIKEGRYIYVVSAVGNDGKIYPPQQRSLTLLLSR